MSTLRFARLGQLAIASQGVFAGCGAIWAVTGILCLMSPTASRIRTLSLVLNTLGLVAVILVWASMGRRLEVLGILAQSIRLATPIAFGALAGVLCERCGVINIAIEGRCSVPPASALPPHSMRSRSGSACSPPSSQAEPWPLFTRF